MIYALIRKFKFTKKLFINSRFGCFFNVIRNPAFWGAQIKLFWQIQVRLERTSKSSGL